MAKNEITIEQIKKLKELSDSSLKTGENEKN